MKCHTRWVKLLRGDLWVCSVCGQKRKDPSEGCVDFDGQTMDCEFRWKTKSEDKS